MRLPQWTPSGLKERQTVHVTSAKRAGAKIQVAYNCRTTLSAHSKSKCSTGSYSIPEGRQEVVLHLISGALTFLMPLSHIFTPQARRQLDNTRRSRQPAVLEAPYKTLEQFLVAESLLTVDIGVSVIVDA
jgi:hypothetical protein